MRFAYPKLQFIIRFLVLAGLFVLLLLFLGMPDTDPVWLAAFGAAGFLAVFLVALTPVLTAHEMGESGITLRQGILFRGFIGWDEIVSVEAVQTRLWVLGLFPAGARGRIVLASGSRDLVSIRLRRKKRFAQLLWRSSDEIIIDLMDPEGFVKAANRKLQG